MNLAWSSKNTKDMQSFFLSTVKTADKNKGSTKCKVIMTAVLGSGATGVSYHAIRGAVMLVVISENAILVVMYTGTYGISGIPYLGSTS